MQFFFFGKENLSKTPPPPDFFLHLFGQNWITFPALNQSLTKRNNNALKKKCRPSPFSGPGQVAVLSIIRGIYQ